MKGIQSITSGTGRSNSVLAGVAWFAGMVAKPALPKRLCSDASIASADKQASPHRQRWQPPTTFGLAWLGGLLVWAAFPPLAWWWLAWLAPIPWIRLLLVDRLAGRHPYRQLYVAGFLQWMLWLQWVRLPHWSAGLGWVAISAYLGIYLPFFISLSRTLIHRRGWPVGLAAPVVWTALELTRTRLFTGFGLLLLGHTQVRIVPLIQIADFGGAYVVSFLVMLVAASLAAISIRRSVTTWTQLAITMSVWVATWGYGGYRLNESVAGGVDRPSEKSVRVALIQGCLDTTFDDLQDPRTTFQRYVELTQRQIKEKGPVDVVMWPESMWTQPWMESTEGFAIPEDVEVSEEAFRQYVADMKKGGPLLVRRMAREFGSALLLGCSTYQFQTKDVARFNSVLAVDRDGSILGRYDKMHPVMFGEYVPLGRTFPWLYKLTPMGQGLTAGSLPMQVAVQGVSFSPCICFENTVPHLVRRQTQELQRQGKMPDVLVTATNDGWFWGSSLLDLHLACGIFRAVEMRLPMLIAANTGFSACIEATGRVRWQGPRRAEGGTVVKVTTRGNVPRPYLWVGDLFAGGCFFLTFGGCVVRRLRPQA